MAPPFDVELQLQRHAGALRELARELLHDGADADDAVQETLARALHSPPRHHERIGGWLAAILRNVAFRLRRAQSRRARHEQRAAGQAPAAAEDDAERIARAELAHRLIAAVDALEPPYRDAIWQRFFEGRAPRDIAAASGVPLSTIKSRLQRGLAALRERFGEREGRDWRAGFAVAFGFGRKGTTAATAAIAGGVVMATWTKVTAAAAAVAAAVLMITWWPEAEVPRTASPERAESAALAAAAPRDDAAAQAVDRAPVLAVPAAAPRDARLAIVRGRCVDTSGKPLAGARVRVTGNARDDETLARWVLDHGELQPLDVASEPSRDDGLFVLELWPPPPCQFLIGVECAGRAGVGSAWRSIAEGATIDLGDVALPHGVRVRGRVVDGKGAPVAGVQIDVQPSSDTRSRARISDQFEACIYRSKRTDDGGTFDLEHPLLPGSYTPRVMNDCVVQSPVTLELVADRPVEDVVVVVARPDAPAITGRVVDDADRPVRGARVATEHDGTSSARDGTFELRCIAGDATKPARITAGGDTPAAGDAQAVVAWGTRDLVLRIARVDLIVRVVDGEGRPVPKGLVHIEAADEGRPYLSVSPGTGSRPIVSRPPLARAHLERGVARFEPIPRGSYRAVVEFGSGSPLQPLVAPFECTGDAQQVVLRAGTERSRTLRVRTNAGAPVAGTRVQVCEMLGNTFDGGPVVREPGAWFRAGGRGKVLVLEEGTTDAGGTLRVRGPFDRTMGLRVLGPGHVPIERSDVSFATDADLVVTVQLGARLRGRIGPAGAMAELRRQAGGDGAKPFADDCQPIVQLFRGEKRQYVPAATAPEAESERFRIGEDGTFDVSGLPADRWYVQVRYWQSVGGVARNTKDVDVGDVTLRDGETTAFDPDLTRLLPGTLEGVVLRNGAPWRSAQLHLECDRGVRADGRRDVDGVGITTDAAGRFTHMGGAGVYSVRHLGLVGSLRAGETVTVERDRVASGTFTFAIGMLALRVLDADGQPADGAAVFARPGDVSGDTKRDGTLSLELAAGSVVLHALPKRLATPDARRALLREAAARRDPDPFGAHLLQVGTANVVAGEATQLELRLPPEWEK